MSAGGVVPGGVSDDLLERALLFASGLLAGDEHDAFEALLLSGDGPAASAFGRVRSAGEFLLRAAAPAAPALITRSRVINGLGMRVSPPVFSQDAHAVDPFADDAGAMVLLRAGEVEWRATGVPGVQTRNLFVDRERKRATVLVRLAPGSVFPDHEHPDAEECLVLDGDLELGGVTMRRFDYMRIPKGGMHGTPRTTGGCLLLVTCGLVEAA